MPLQTFAGATGYDGKLDHSMKTALEFKSTLLVSCLQGGFGDHLLEAWLIPRIWRNSGLNSAIAVLSANCPEWMSNALRGFQVWKAPIRLNLDDTMETEKYDRLASAAARSSNVSRVDALGPNQIPTLGDWTRSDVDLYTRIASLAEDGVYPQIPVSIAGTATVDEWLFSEGLREVSKLIVVHARSETVFDLKNPLASSVRKLVQLLLLHLPVEVAILGRTEDYSEMAGPRCLVCPEVLPVPILGGLISRAFAFVGSDSGPRHLAAMLNTEIFTFTLPSIRDRGPFTSPERVHRVDAVFPNGRFEPFDFDTNSVVEAISQRI